MTKESMSHSISYAHIFRKTKLQKKLLASCSQQKQSCHRKIIKLASGFLKYKYTSFQVLSVSLIEIEIPYFSLTFFIVARERERERERERVTSDSLIVH